MAIQEWIPAITSSAVFTGIVLWAGHAAKAGFEKTLQASFDQKLERLRSDFRREEETLKAGLKANEDTIAALRSGALTNMAQREAELSKRRQRALEDLWRAVMEYAPYKAAAKFSEVIKLDELVKGASGRGREAEAIREWAEFTLKLSGLDPVVALQLRPDADRPFISPVVWAMFKAYRSVVLYPAVKLMAAKNGVSADVMVADQGLISIAVAALPHHAPNFEKFGGAFLSHLPEEMEEKLLGLITDALNGVLQDAAAIANAEKILREVAKRDALLEVSKVAVPEGLQA